MTDSPEEEAIRRALAAARHTDPIPDDVAARLDATLAALVQERQATGAPPSPAHPVPPVAQPTPHQTPPLAPQPGSPFPGPTGAPHSAGPAGPVPAPGAQVVPLEARRRPSLARRMPLLVAAAGAVVALASAPAWWPSSDSDTNVNSSTGAAGDSQQESEDSARPPLSRSETSAPGAASPEPEVPRSSATETSVPQLRTGPDLEEEVARVAERAEPVPTSGGDPTCRPPALLDTDTVARALRVDLDGTDAWLTVPPSVGAPRTAVVIDCAGTRLATFVLP